jgi:CMP-N-acetylneuraminic acid synthetase
MISGKRILAVCPARGGSKGIRLKNLRTIAGVSLVGRVGMVVTALPEIDCAVVSTDHDEIALEAERHGLRAPFRRAEELSGDRVADHPVLVHALLEMERIDGVQYDIVVMLQPTSPLRTPNHVRDTLEMLDRDGWDAVWTVSETDSKGHPLKQFVIDPDEQMAFYDEAGKAIIARQQLKPVFHRNGIAYAITRECLLNQNTIFGRRTGALLLDGHFISIDTEWDISLVQFIWKNQQKTAGNTV